MKKILFFGIFFFIAYQCFACGSEQNITLSSGKVIHFGYIYMDQSKVKEKLKNEGENLSDRDIDILADFVTRRLSVIEQTEKEYLEKMKQINSECPLWEQIERKEKWTAYKETGKIWVNGRCEQLQC